MSFKTIALASRMLLGIALKSTLIVVTWASLLNTHCLYPTLYDCGKKSKTQALQRIPPWDTPGQPHVPNLPCMDAKDQRSEES